MAEPVFLSSWDAEAGGSIQGWGEGGMKVGREGKTER